MTFLFLRSYCDSHCCEIGDNYSRLQNRLPLDTHFEFFCLPVERRGLNLAGQKVSIVQY
jgi:hypothetical protein